MPDTLLKVTTDHQGQTESLVQESSLSKSDDQVTGRQGFSLFKCLGDTERRNKLMQSWLIVWAFFSLGLTAGLNGSTLLDLQIITETDLESASAFFTGFTSGYMAGSLFSGLVFNKINTGLLLFVALSGMGIVSIISPYCSIYALMIFIRSFCGFFAGIIDTAGNAWHMKIWGSEGKVLLQIIHFFFALGGVLSPLYTEPFLAKRFMDNGTATDNFTTGNTSQLYYLNDPQTTNVQYAFLVSGIFMIITSIPFIVMFIKPPSQNIENHLEQNINFRITYRKLPCCLHFFIQTILCIIYLSYGCIGLAFASFLMSFLINEYDSMTKAKSVYITTVFWVSFATSRFLMIFVSKLLSNVRLLFLCLFLMVTAFTGFMVSAVFEVIPAIVVFTAMTGLGMSGIFAGGVSWAETELLKVTARVSSSITIAMSTGKIFIPLILGFLMEEASNMWFCYILLGQTVLLCLLFMFLLLFNRLYINMVYGPMTLAEKNIPVYRKEMSLNRDERECEINESVG